MGTVGGGRVGSHSEHGPAHGRQAICVLRGSATNLELDMESEQDTGLTDGQWLESHGSDLARVVGSGHYPQLASVIARRAVDLDVETFFDFGLQRLLDGYAVLIDQMKPAISPLKT
jgi:Tetracyclin repressor-like, C-terminal domain